MALYPRQRPRENADSLVDRAAGERRSEHRDYAHDDRTSPLRPSWTGARQAQGRAGTASGGGGTEPTTPPANEVFRIAVTSRAASQNQVAIMALRDNGSAQAVAGSPFTLPAAANMSGIAYGREGGVDVLYIASASTTVSVYKINAATGMAMPTTTGISVGVEGIATNMGHGGAGSGSRTRRVYYAASLAGRTHVGLQDTASPFALSAGSARWGTVPGSRSARGLTFDPTNQNLYLIDSAEVISRMGFGGGAGQTTLTGPTGGPSVSDPNFRVFQGSALTYLNDPQGIAFVRTVSATRFYIPDNHHDAIVAYDATTQTRVPAADITYASMGLDSSARVMGIATRLPSAT